MASAKAQKPSRECAKAPCGEDARSVEIASSGLDTTQDFTRFGSALITDIMTDKVDTKKANTAIRGVGAVLRSAEFQFRHGNGGKAVNLTNLDGARSAQNDKKHSQLREKFEAFLETL